MTARVPGTENRLRSLPIMQREMGGKILTDVSLLRRKIEFGCIASIEIIKFLINLTFRKFVLYSFIIYCVCLFFIYQCGVS
jgi:hypothetical protein